MRADPDIQFAALDYPPEEPRETPQWLIELGEFLYRIFAGLADLLGISWPVFKWILIGAGIVLLLVLLWRMIEPLLGIRRRAPVEEESHEQWAPDRADALSLLEKADRLASEGKFAEATHLLLQGSVEQISSARPGWLAPSVTAREIAGHGSLPDRARVAFETIAERVERSLFALRGLDAGDWRAARDAYSDFALADLGAASH
ncbi:MAG TPA: hypothetical protein VLA37_06825 [Sphingomonadaceae bacterium]|nr:hypothetical protein [Sphingomonadaceae bacterium]